MTFLELVKKRASIREYAPTPVPRQTIEKCLEAARMAPSACNAQPWNFIVVDEPALKNKLADAAFSGIYSMNSFAKNAPALVVVIREISGGFATVGGFFRSVQYNLIDIGIACEHFILQAAEEGVGTCWLGWFNEKAVKKVMGIRAGLRVEIMISAGYPAAESSIEKTRKTLGELVKYNSGTSAGRNYSAD